MWSKKSSQILAIECQPHLGIRNSPRGEFHEAQSKYAKNP